MCFVDNREKYKQVRKEYNETNDCTVVAFAEVFDTTYERAHKHLKEKCGRVNRKGVYTNLVLPQSLVNTKFRTGGPYENKPRTLGQFVKDFPEGRYYVCVRDHALAIVDGVICDHKHSPRRKVKWVMRVII